MGIILINNVLLYIFLFFFFVSIFITRSFLEKLEEVAEIQFERVGDKRKDNNELRRW